ncbi:cupin domain-containing protein [Labrys okinawensis]|uniref:cupin domain-containing protein n=1 Tax=Labrys okinawensis TaxID=346911 RepID=UPI0039BC6A99
MPKINAAALPFVARGGYPPPYDKAVAGRSRKRLGDEVGLTQFGVNLTKLPPGVASSVRHWHENQDEFVFVIEGELTLLEDDSETLLRPGDAAGFKAGVANGHQLVNRTSSDTIYLEIGARTPRERVHFSDVDLVATADEGVVHYSRRDGNPL